MKLVKPYRPDNHHLGAYISIVLGPNDDKLVWPFAGNVTMELLNQSHDQGHVSHTCSWVGAGERSTRRRK